MRRSPCTNGRMHSSRASGSHRMSPPRSATWRWSTATSTISRKPWTSYNRARDYCESHGMPLLVLRADYNVAFLYYLRGEYARALELYRTAKEACDALGDTYHSALCDLDRSEIYLELNLSGEAADLGSRALVRFDKLGMGVRGREGRDERRHRDQQPGRAPARAGALRAGARPLRARAESGVAGARRFLGSSRALPEWTARARPTGLPDGSASVCARICAAARGALRVAACAPGAGDRRPRCRRPRVRPRLRKPGRRGDAQPDVSGALRPRPDPRGAGRPALGVRGLPGFPCAPRTSAQSSSGR